MVPKGSRPAAAHRMRGWEAQWGGGNVAGDLVGACGVADDRLLGCHQPACRTSDGSASDGEHCWGNDSCQWHNVPEHSVNSWVCWALYPACHSGSAAFSRTCIPLKETSPRCTPLQFHPRCTIIRHGSARAQNLAMLMVKGCVSQETQPGGCSAELGPATLKGTTDLRSTAGWRSETRR